MPMRVVPWSFKTSSLFVEMGSFLNIRKYKKMKGIKL